MKDTGMNVSNRTAMDAAIRRAYEQGANNALKAHQAEQQARRDVAPVLGDIPPQDSAGAVYRMALDAAGIATKDVPDVAMKALFAVVRRNGNGRPPGMALDAAATSRRKERFPNGDRLVSGPDMTRYA